jgi:hypothetical protein
MYSECSLCICLFFRLLRQPSRRMATECTNFFLAKGTLWFTGSAPRGEETFWVSSNRGSHPVLKVR